MQIKIISVGKTKDKQWLSSEQKYIQRIGNYGRVVSLSVKEASYESLRNVDLVQKNEAKELENRMTECYAVALDKSGKQLSSRQFAAFMQQRMTQRTRNLAFIIGGAYGLAPSVLQRADFVLSLSKMTFLHEMSKVLLLEQIYRAFTILNGEPYHK